MRAGGGSEGVAEQKLYKTRYRGLHREEEARLLGTATSMTLVLHQLTLCVRVYGHARADFAEFFTEAEDGADAICAEMRDRGVYTHAPGTYARCHEKLDEGMRLLRAAAETKKQAGLEGHFTEMKEKGEHCQACFDAYAKAWSAILEFDKENSNAWWQRWHHDRHAFSPKASMAGMLRELRKLGSAQC
jgi:hypothetical protein